MTKSFLLKLDQNNTSSSYKNLLFKEFIDGVKPNDTYDVAMMESIKRNLKNNFGWNESISFQKLASHKCKDMLVVTSKNNKYYCPQMLWPIPIPWLWLGHFNTQNCNMTRLLY